MQVKKDMMVSLGLILICVGLLIAAALPTKTPVVTPNSCAGVKCIPQDGSLHQVSPWKFLTEGVLHLSA